MTHQTHVLFIVDQSSDSDTSRFSKIIRRTMKDRNDSFDVYTFADKGRLRVRRNVGNLTIRPLKSGDVHPYKNLSTAIEGLGERLEALSPEDRPDHVMVVLLSDHVDNADDHDAYARAVEEVSAQSYVYKWKFMVGGDTRFEVADSLHLPDSNVLRTDDVDASVGTLRRLLDDIRDYGDCGTFAEDR